MTAPLIIPFRTRSPRIDSAAWIAPTAVIIGDTEIASGVNVWFGAVLRGDIAPIRVGAYANVQDGAVVHVSSELKEGTHIGANVTVGHMCLIHACTLEDACFIGMKACVMDGAVVETGAWVAAGAVVTPGKRVPKGQLWAGTPARYLREVMEDEARYIEELPRHYAALAAAYR
jgi:carbonic anhydrase/acetyltransferase-like protein (isoleucine patch superfamily)